MQIQDNLCQICSTNHYKYTCPRCNILYCCVKCYQAISHSNCSEAFYKECVQDYLQSQEPNPESREKMLKILQRVNDDEHIDCSSDSDDDEDIHERLKNMNLNDANSLWEKLTKEEKKEFINLIKEGDVTQLLPLWEPWWNKKCPKPKVRFVDEENSNYLEHCPPVMKGVKPLSHYTKTKPSELVFYNLVNVLASFTVLARYCNGEYNSMAQEASMILLTISKNLSENSNYTSIDIALESVLQEAINCEFISTTEDCKINMKEDLIKIIEGPNKDDRIYYILATLSEIYSILKQYKNFELPRSNKGKFTQIFPDVGCSLHNFPKEKVAKCLHKIKYYHSWSLQYYNDNYYRIN